MPDQTKSLVKEDVSSNTTPLMSDLTEPPGKKKIKPSIIVKPTMKYDTTNNDVTKMDCEPLTKPSTHGSNSNMAKSISNLDFNLDSNPNCILPSEQETTKNDNSLFPNEGESDQFSLQITSVGSIKSLVSSFIEDLDNPSDIVIDKVLKLISKRKDILEKIVLNNVDQVKEIMVKHGKFRPDQQEKLYDSNEYFKMLESRDFLWTDPMKKVHKFTPSSVQMKRLKIKNPKKTITITPTNVPTFYLPLFLNNFDVLDSQGPAEKCRETRAFKPRLKKKVSRENVLGYHNKEWVYISQDNDFESVSMTVENPNSGETCQSWCGMSSPTK